MVHTMTISAYHYDILWLLWTKKTIKMKIWIRNMMIHQWIWYDLVHGETLCSNPGVRMKKRYHWSRGSFAAPCCTMLHQPQPCHPQALAQRRDLSSSPFVCLFWCRPHLVVGSEHFLFSPKVGMTIQSDFHIFQRGSWNHQPVINLKQENRF